MPLFNLLLHEIMMKKFAWESKVFLCAIFTSLIPMNSLPFAQAHSPSDVSLSYNSQTSELSVSITHSVSDPSTHYVESVEISLNSQNFHTFSYTSQPDANQFTYTYEINLTAGDVVEVTATCNLGGSKSASLTFNPADDSTDDTTNDSTDNSIDGSTDTDSSTDRFE